MRALLASLHSLTADANPSLQRVLDYGHAVYGDTFEHTPALRFCIETFTAFGRYPEVATLNRELTLDLMSEEALSDPDMHLAKIVDHYQTMALKKRVMEVGGLPSRKRILQGSRDLVIEFDEGPRDQILGDLSGLSIEDIYKGIRARPKGIRTCITLLDDTIFRVGMQRVCTIGGFTGSFKTTMAVNMLEQNSRDGFNQAFFSLEMPKDEIYQKLLSRHSRSITRLQEVAFFQINTGQLTDAQMRDLVSVEADLKQQPGKILIYDSADLISCGAVDFTAALETLCRKADDECDGKLHVVYFDHIQLAKFYMHGYGTDLEKGNTVVSKFRELALSFRDRGLIAVLLSQFNRDSYAKACKREGTYTLSAFAEVNEIERSSSYCISLFSSTEMKAQRSLKWQLLKHRGGETIEEPQLTDCEPETGFIGAGLSGELFSMDMVSHLANLEEKPTKQGSMNLDDYAPEQ